ncbi:MAG: acylphosphatase [Planctomycetes bacterium]|nr:acylphosphatase [Planctomycetota bacterium]
MPAKRFRVIGRVQGVAFRASTLDVALDLSLSGFVRNLPDGSVEVIAQGPPPALARLEQFLRRGPPLARVERIESEPRAELDSPPPFHIAH